MKAIKPARAVAQEAIASDTLRCHNLLNDFAALGALLLPELEAAAASSAENSVEAGGADALSPTSQMFQRRNAHLLDAFLLAAGMNQIVEDYLHRGILLLDKAAGSLERVRLPLLGKLLASSMDEISAGFYRLRGWPPRQQHLARWQMALAAFVERLADELARPMNLESGTAGQAAQDQHQARQRAEDLVDAARELLASAQRVPADVLSSIARIPSCFRSFDQRPEDCQNLARQFAARWPDRSLPLIVVGIRTSGSYLAPLYAAILRALGYRDVKALTMRPGHRWLRAERACLIQHAKRGGRVLIADDPPATGSSFVASARALERLGIARQSISLLLPLFNPLDALPAELRAYDTICLLWEQWAIHEQMGAAAIEQALARLLTGQTIRVSSSQGAPTRVTVESVQRVERLPLTPAVHALGQPLTIPAYDQPGLRGHLRGVYRAQVVDKESGQSCAHDLYVKSVGLGYFGGHALAVARPLRQFLPDIYGLSDGLLYRAWLPERQRLSTLPDDVEAMATQVAAYVALRRQLLPVPEDFSQRLGAGKAVWWRGSFILRNAFGRAAPLARPAVRRAARRLLQGVEHPLAIDGSMAPDQWFVTRREPDAGSDEAPALLKVDFADRGFSNQDMHCYDAFFDLAMAAVYADLKTGGATAFPSLLRQHFARITGESASDERWLLYQLVCLWKEREALGRVSVYALGRRPYASAGDVELAERDSPSTKDPALLAAVVPAAAEVDRELSRLYARYIGERFFADITPPAAGPLCAIDIDGVLEMGWLSFSAMTPAGALALRALSRHGYRPVLATGRSLGEARDRCQAYRLAGAVAEYGAVIYNHLTGQAAVLLNAAEQADLAALRSVFESMEGVFVDAAYQYAVRAYYLDRHGKRRGLKPETIEQALAQTPGSERLRPIIGIGQTDFMVTTIDKGTGLRALAASLAGEADVPTLAFAAGDTLSDLAMFERAKRAFAPANADAALKEHSRSKPTNLQIMPRPHQAGLLQAVAQFLGHQPRRCAACQPPPCSADATLLLTALAAQDGGKWGKARQGVLLALRANLAGAKPRR